jgi:hypothetical protein
MLVEAQAKASFGQHTSKRGLAHFQRITPQVVPVQLNQVEGVEEGTVVVTVVANEIERCHAVVVASNRLPIDERTQAGQRLDAESKSARLDLTIGPTSSQPSAAAARSPFTVVSEAARQIET